MDKVQGIFLSNLPKGISEEELLKELKRIFRNGKSNIISNIFLFCYKNKLKWIHFPVVAGLKKLSVEVFKPDGIKQTAIAYGFHAVFSDLMEAISCETIKGRSVRIFPVSS